jgi:hypothetical protein
LALYKNLQKIQKIFYIVKKPYSKTYKKYKKYFNSKKALYKKLTKNTKNIFPWPPLSKKTYQRVEANSNTLVGMVVCYSSFLLLSSQLTHRIPLRRTLVRTLWQRQ